MIRQDICRQQGTLFVCAFCRNCRSPPWRISPVPPARSWYSTNGQNDSNQSRARQIQSSVGFGLRRLASVPSDFGGAGLRLPPRREPGGEDDFLLPNERAARANAQAKKEKGQFRSAFGKPPIKAGLGRSDSPPLRPMRSSPLPLSEPILTPKEKARRDSGFQDFSRPASRPTWGRQRSPISRESFVSRDAGRNAEEIQEPRPAWGQLTRRRAAELPGTGEFVPLRKGARTDIFSSLADMLNLPSEPRISDSQSWDTGRLPDSRGPHNTAATKAGADKASSGMASSGKDRTDEGGSDTSDFWSQIEDKVVETKKPPREADSQSLESWDWGFESKSPLSASLRPQSLPTLTSLPSYSGRSARYEVSDESNSHKKERHEGPRSKKPPKNSRRRSEEDEDEGYDERAEMLAEARRARKAARNAEKARLDAARKQAPTPILLPEFITIARLGEALGITKDRFLGELENLGFEDITLDSVMTGETAGLVAQEFNFEPTIHSGDRVDLKPRPPPEDPSLLPPRPPIVTIMGHVDHGKTTMLDWLRKSSIVSGEHGGITQHIGAFSVRMPTGKQITFLDTPGHAAFLTMRQRGANITDIVILVVAADDSVKPQTLEALRHARSARVPIIVAVNKVDKPEARIEHVKADLANNGVEIEEYGGDVPVVFVSAKTGLGMDELEETIVTLAEVLDMRAEQDGLAEGWVLESSVKPIGRVATVLVKRGTLRKSDCVVAGTAFARIKTMYNEAGEEIEEASPGTPVEILGWRHDAPAAGDMLLQAPDEARARDAIRYREYMASWEQTAAQVAEQEKNERERAEAADAAAEDAEPLKQSSRSSSGRRPDAAEAAPPESESGTAVVNFIIKGDVAGSVEAVCGSITELGNNEVRARILRSGPGQITESDVDHAATTGSHIVNFNNAVAPHIQTMANRAGVGILDHNVIYHLTDNVKDIMSEKLVPNLVSRVVGEGDVLQLFAINTKGRLFKNIAGCRVRNGHFTSAGLYRVLRNGEKVFDGKLESLKFKKKEMSEIKKGSECGLQFLEWEGMQSGDQIQCYEEVREKRHL